MLEEILTINNEFNLQLTISEINSILELNEEEKNSFKHVPAERYDYYLKEYTMCKLLVCICNKKLTHYTKLTNDLKQSSINISIVAAKHMYNNEDLLDCLQTLKYIAEGSPCACGSLPQKIFNIFGI